MALELSESTPVFLYSNKAKYIIYPVIKNILHESKIWELAIANLINLMIIECTS
jgi:hypothetical protein